MFFDRETSALSQTDDTRQRSSLAIMEIAAGPGRRPAPAAGRGRGVVDDRFETFDLLTEFGKSSPSSRRSRCALPRSPRPLPTMSGDAVSRALVDPMQRRRDRPPRLHRDLGWTAIDESNQRLPTMEPARVDTRVLRQRAAWLAVGCLVLRWVSGRGRPGRRVHEIGHGRRFFAAHRSPIAGQRAVVAPLRPGLFYRAGDGRFSCRQGERGRIDRVLPCQVPAGERWTDDDFQCRSRGAPTTGNRDYRWSSTPDADRCAVFGIRLGLARM